MVENPNDPMVLAVDGGRTVHLLGGTPASLCGVEQMPGVNRHRSYEYGEMSKWAERHLCRNCRTVARRLVRSYAAAGAFTLDSPRDVEPAWFGPVSDPVDWSGQ